MPNIGMIRVLSRSFPYAHVFRIRRKDGHRRTLMRDKDQRVASKFILITSRGGIFCVGDRILICTALKIEREIYRKHHSGRFSDRDFTRDKTECRKFYSSK